MNSSHCISGLILITSLLSSSLTRAADPPVAKAVQADEGHLYVGGSKGLLRLTPDGKEVKDLSQKSDPTQSGRCAVSPDGSRIVFPVCEEPVEITTGKGSFSTARWKVMFRDLSGATDLTDVPKQNELFTREVVWSRDGKRLYCSLGRSVEDYTQIVLAGKIPNERNGYLAVDVATGKAARSPIPPRHTLLGERKDGSFVIVGYVRELRKVAVGLLELNHPRLFVLSADGKEQRPVEVEMPDGTNLKALSPTCDRILSWVRNPEKQRREVVVIDLSTAKCTILDIRGLPEDGWVWHLAWSPDGKRIAFTYEFTNKEVPHTSCVAVVDADGKNFKEIRRTKVENHRWIDWR